MCWFDLLSTWRVLGWIDGGFCGEYNENNELVGDIKNNELIIYKSIDEKNSILF